jgi:TonB family protein
LNPMAHLWESTLVVVVAAALTLALRPAPARLRHGVWLLASLKFLVPFSVVTVAGGAAAGWAMAYTPRQLSATVSWLDRSFSILSIGASAAPATGSMQTLLTSALPILFGVWSAGAVTILVWRFRQARTTMTLRRSSSTIERGREHDALRRILDRLPRPRRLELRRSASTLEPAVVGVLRPTIVWPDGLSDRLDDAELESILAHEVCHVVRRDNLAGYIHVAVETIFWFHPLVWWLGARLLHERERACDEEVLRMGAHSESYAEGILKVCGFCLRAPAAFAAGVCGSALSQRIERIVRQPRGASRAPATRWVITALAVLIAAPSFAVGAATAAATQERGTVYKPGDGVKHPVLVREVKPKYTAEAIRARIQGVVRMAAVVLKTGDIGDVRITQSLDNEYGLDDEAVKAVKQWVFEPGTKDGKAVAVEIEIEMSFALKQ